MTRRNASAPTLLVEDEGAVSEVVGFLITFGISTMLLITGLLAMDVIRDFSDDAASARQVEAVAGRVHERIMKAANAAVLFPEADFESIVPLPAPAGSRGYTVEIWGDDPLDPLSDRAQVRVISNSGRVASIPLLAIPEDAGDESYLFCVDPADRSPEARCAVSADEGQMVVVYDEYDPAGDPGVRRIFIRR